MFKKTKRVELGNSLRLNQISVTFNKCQFKGKSYVYSFSHQYGTEYNKNYRMQNQNHTKRAFV